MCIFIGLLSYVLIVLSERALISLTSFDIENLRSASSPEREQLLVLVENVRPTLGSLFLARVFFQILVTVYSVTWLASSLPWSSIAISAYILLTGVLAASFWTIDRMPKVGRPLKILKRLRWFIVFWKTVFGTITKKENRAFEKISQEKNGETLPMTISERREIEMLKSIVKFSDLTVKQVMQQRADVVAVDFRTKFGELLNTVRESGFSRVPVYDEDLDNVTGILYIKDLVPHLKEGYDFEWQPLIRTNFLLVPEVKRISELLTEFKKHRLHIAIVVDEYGGSAGLVTMEDVLEEVTGDIQDEFDEENELRYTKLDERNYLFEGRTPLSDVCRISGIEENTFEKARNDSDSLAGLVLEIHGDIPKKGAEIRWQKFALTVTMSDNRRIEQIKLTLPLP